MSDVSRLIIRPSLEGTLADSLMVWVWIDISLFVFSGLMTWMPSPSVSPVTLPKSVSTPTWPVPTRVTELKSRITSRNAAIPKPIRRSRLPPCTAAINHSAASRIKNRHRSSP